MLLNRKSNCGRRAAEHERAANRAARVELSAAGHDQSEAERLSGGRRPLPQRLDARHNLRAVGRLRFEAEIFLEVSLRASWIALRDANESAIVIGVRPRRFGGNRRAKLCLGLERAVCARTRRRQRRTVRMLRWTRSEVRRCQRRNAGARFASLGRVGRDGEKATILFRGVG